MKVNIGEKAYHFYAMGKVGTVEKIIWKESLAHCVGGTASKSPWVVLRFSDGSSAEHPMSEVFKQDP